MTGGPPLGEAEAAADDYNIRSHYLDVSTDLRRAFRHGPLRVDSTVPPISLITLEGEPFEVSSLLREHHVALVFGSYSAPPCTLELAALERLGRSLEESGSRLVFVYTREIHPNEPLPPDGLVIPTHTTLADKVGWARRLKDDFALTMPVLVDSLSGTVHRAFGALPFQAVVIDRDGILVFRSEWVDVAQLAAVLANLDERDRIAASGSFRNSYSEGLWAVDASVWH